MRPHAREGGIRTVAVVGGGIAGLAAAVRLSFAPEAPKVLLLESRDRIGGLLHTIVRDGYMIEEAADSLPTGQSPELRNLCRRIGLDEQMIPAGLRRHHAMVLQGACLRPVPFGFTTMTPTRFWPLVTTRTLTVAGKLRLAMEPLVSTRRHTEDESVAQFASRRLGRQAYERLVLPLAEAIYGRDPAELSMAATMPRLAELERRHGSLFRAAVEERKERQRKVAPEKPTEGDLAPRAPQKGMIGFVAALGRQLPEDSIWLNSPVEQLIRRNDGRWGIRIGGVRPRLVTVDGVIVATPASFASQIVKSVCHHLASELAKIEYGSRCHITLGYKSDQFRHRPNSLGVFVPHSAQMTLRSITFPSEKFPGRAPQGSVQLRITLSIRNGGPVDHLNDSETADLASVEIARLFPTRGNPQFYHVVRHHHAIPQYTLGHASRIVRIVHCLNDCPGLTLAGAAYRGIGVPQCVSSGEQAADKILRHLYG